MTFATIMVHLDGARSNASVLHTTAVIAERHNARVIGIAACQPMQIPVSDAYFTGDFAVLERDLVDEELLRARADFEGCAALAPYVLEWRSAPTVTGIAQMIANEARSSDLVVVGATFGHGSASTHADIGDLVVRAGRPVLVVPEAGATADFKTIVVAWKDTGECRRAIVDALPLLHAAERIMLVQVTADAVEARSQVHDVIGWLARHGLNADTIIAHPDGGSIERLAAIASENDADLIVAGGYGHGRLREWAFGGMTRDLLLHEPRCAMLSH